MIIARTFRVTLYGEEVDTVCFIGDEYDSKAVRDFLIQNERANMDIEVKQMREIRK